MKQIQNVVLITFLLIVSISDTACQLPPVKSIIESYVDGDVPDEKDFDNFLKRDLAAYFKESTGKDLRVDYELLRK